MKTVMLEYKTNDQEREALVRATEKSNSKRWTEKGVCETEMEELFEDKVAEVWTQINIFQNNYQVFYH